MSISHKLFTKYRLVFLPAMDPELVHRELYRSAYSSWHTVWRETLIELKGNPALPMDSFTRQHEILCVAVEQKCVALLLLRWLNFDLLDFRADSYFETWPKDAVEVLVQKGPSVLIASYMTVVPEYRRCHSGIRFRDVILDLMVQRLLCTETDVLGAITRRDRGVQKLCYDMGAECLAENIPFHNDNDKVDFIAMEREKIRRSDEPELRAIGDHLWSTRQFAARLAPQTQATAEPVKIKVAS